MDQETEHIIQTCDTCQESHKMPVMAPLHPWEWPDQTWTRLHVDYASLFLGKMLLVLVDACSKCLKMYPISTSNNEATI